jgi:hypothetical protein
MIMTILAPTPIGLTTQASNLATAREKVASVSKLLALFIVAIAAGPLPATAADAQSDHAGAAASSATSVSRQRARVQPQAWEFSAPYGAPDVSPADARDVDELYQQLIHGTLAQRPTDDHPGAGERR